MHKFASCKEVDWLTHQVPDGSDGVAGQPWGYFSVSGEVQLLSSPYLTSECLPKDRACEEPVGLGNRRVDGVCCGKFEGGCFQQDDARVLCVKQMP
jgi:hypothetical protein